MTCVQICTPQICIPFFIFLENTLVLNMCSAKNKKTSLTKLDANNVVTE